MKNMNKGAIADVQQVNLTESENENLNLDEDEKIYKELNEIIEQIDFSVLKNTNGEIEVGTPLSGAKKRKISKEAMLEKKLDETLKQIDLAKKALKRMYDMEDTRFTKCISKRRSKPRSVVSKTALMNQFLENGKAIPLWIGIDDEEPPPLCGAIETNEDYVAEDGDLVAARIDKKEKDKTEETWILAEVINYDKKGKCYKVDDIYENQKACEITKQIIPLPKMRADPESNPEALFPERTKVLAMYPQTTCFYPAIVYKQPKKAHEPYLLRFEDTKYENGYSPETPVIQRYVIKFI